MSKWITIAKVGDIKEGETKPVTVDDKSICVSQVSGKYYAFIDVCSHMEFPLHDGTLENTVIECAHHGATFDIRTGEVLSMPAVTPIEVFPVKVEGESILIEVS